MLISDLAASNQRLDAGVAELADALDLGSSDASRGGSSPSARTIKPLHHTPPTAEAGGDALTL